MAETASSRIYPGLDVTGASDADFVLAAADDWSPTAVEERDAALRIFFATAEDRDAAASAIVDACPGTACTAVDVPDERWAERSQAALTRVRIGALTVAPPWDVPDDGTTVITILPSMGFGTGHHASTRLCLALLQDIDVADTRVCDVGTGSGVLAIAAVRLGARDVVALDYDNDSIVCARESAELNHITAGLTIAQVDLEREGAITGAPFDLVLANLTGGLLQRLRDTLLRLIRPGGRLILSGVTVDEREAVLRAFEDGGCVIDDVRTEGDWIGARLTRPVPDAPQH